MALYCLLLFMQNLAVLATSTISYSFGLDFGGVDAAIARRFHPHWILPRPAESWFDIHLHPHHFPETMFCGNM